MFVLGALLALAGAFPQIALAETRDEAQGPGAQTQRAAAKTQTAQPRQAAAAIQLVPNTAALETGDTLAFTALIKGLSNPQLVWAVNGVAGGSATYGTITQGGVYQAPAKAPAKTVTVSARSAANPKVSGTAQLTVSQRPKAAQLYGASVGFDVLNNLSLGQGDVDYRFRAQKSGSVKGILWFDIYKHAGTSPGCSGAACECDGYGCGTGGEIEICIYPDDGTAAHLPTDPLTQRGTGRETEPLACVLAANPRSGLFLRSDLFDNQPWLEGGALYHLHWHNADPDAAHNYVSVDDACTWHPTTPRQPGYSNTDLAALSIWDDGTSIRWREQQTDTPIFQLQWSDGSVQGQGYLATWNSAAAAISGSQQVRERFKVSGTGRAVTALSVRANRVKGTGPLTVTLATLEGNTIESGQIAASKFPLGPALTGDPVASANVTPAWGMLSFKSAHVLNQGGGYQVILSAPAGTVYQTYGVERGDINGFQAPAVFMDGYGQFSTNGGASWTGFTQPDGTASGNQNRKNGDLQFYFTLL